MKKFVFYSIFAFTTILFSTNITAQEKPRVVVKNPKGRESEKLKDKPIEAVLRNEKEIFCVEDGIIPLKQPDEKEASGYPTLNFGDTFNFVDTEQVGSSMFYLLAKGDANDPSSDFQHIGWVDGESLLLTSECLKDETTKIQKKALLVVQNKPGSFELKGAPRWTNSRGLGASLKPIEFYSILYCYKKRNGFTLLGFQGKFKPGLDKNSLKKDDFWATMAGWVPDSNFEEWNTREALQWNSESTLENFGPKRRVPDGQIFNSRKDAILSRSSSVVPGLVELKDEKNQSPSWPVDKMRYTILPISSKINKDNNSIGEPVADPDGGLADIVDPVQGRLFRIGVIGDFVNSKGEVVKREELDLFRKKLDMIASDLEYTEILVIIDATSSMDMWLNKAVPQWIEKIVQQSQKKMTQKVRIAACLYRDIDDQAKRKAATSLDSAVTYIPWEDIKEKGTCALVQKLKDEKAKDGGDPCEQFIHGLKFGLTQASKDIKPHSHKLVVLIGDMGNHVSNNGPQDLAQDIQKISKLMVPENGTPWELLAIQVPNSNAGAQSDYQLFRDQSEAICEAVRGQIELQNKELGQEKSISIKTTKEDTILEVVNRETINSVLTELETHYAANEKKLVQLRKEALELARGTRGGAGITPTLEKIMAQENIDYSKLNYSGFQVFREGWVWEKNKSREPQVQIQVLLTTEELQTLCNKILAPIEEASLEGRDPHQNLNEKMADALNNLQTGEKPSKHPNSYKNIMARRHSLTLKSKLFDISFGVNNNGEYATNEDGKKNTDKYSELSILSKKKRLLEDALGKTQRDYVEIKTRNSAGNTIKTWGPKGPPTPKDRFFNQPGASTVNQFIWIDGETEFP